MPPLVTNGHKWFDLAVICQHPHGRFREGFRMPADVSDGPGIRPASESLRRTNPWEAASGLPSMGILSGGGLGEA